MIKFGIQVCARSLLFHCGKPLGNKVAVVAGLTPQTPQIIQALRNMSFFNKVTAEEIWKGTTTVSNAGRKRGRGKGMDRKRKENLNQGKRIGVGEEGMVWPGLTCPVIRSKSLVSIHKLPQAPPPVERVMHQRRRVKVHPMLRGWTSKSMEGKQIGPPDPRENESFDGFESYVVHHKIRTSMSGIFGRKKSFVSIVVTGNKNGVMGFGSATTLDSKSAVRLAKNRAAKKLIGIDLQDKHTVNHDFYSQFGRTRLQVWKKPEGYGLKCHRILKICCQVLGIKNLSAKAYKASNKKNLLRAFIIGLLNQKKYQQMADEKKLHLVEFREEMDNFPKLLASPKVCLTEAQARKKVVNFQEYIMGEKIIWMPPKKVPFYQKLPSWETHLKRTLFMRNHDKVKWELMVHYGELRSHLTDAYPECIESTTPAKSPQKEEEL